MKDFVYKNTIKAAEKLFNRFGVAKTAVTDVAELADVSRATIFNNFGNKEGLLKAVLEYRKKEFQNEIQGILKSTASFSGGLKLIIIKKIKLLSGLKFISDKQIAADSSSVRNFIKDINSAFLKISEDLLRLSGKSKLESRKILDTVNLLVKGIEQVVFESFDSFSIKNFESDIDYFLKLALPESGAEV